LKIDVPGRGGLLIGRANSDRKRKVGLCESITASAFEKLYPIPQFKATAKLGGFLAQLLA
jgi:hypothetical protein